MLEKLELVEKRLNEIEQALAAEDLYSDPQAAAKLLKEQKEILPVVEAFRSYKKAQRDLQDAEELMHGDDAEMRELAQMEYEEAKERSETLEQQIKVLLLPKDENDDKNVIVEIRGGVGGEEAALFAHSLFRMYSMYAERKRFSVEVLSSNETELGGIKEISFEVRGSGAWSRFKYESGTHRVQRVPETEKWKWRSTLPTCRSTPIARAAPAGSTSTKRNLPSASPTCPPALWWSARMSAASTKTRTGP